jgi:hypothetical protein
MWQYHILDHAKFNKFLIFEKNIVICFVNVESDLRLWYTYITSVKIDKELALLERLAQL